MITLASKKGPYQTTFHKRKTLLKTAVPSGLWEAFSHFLKTEKKVGNQLVLHPMLWESALQAKKLPKGQNANYDRLILRAKVRCAFILIFISVVIRVSTVIQLSSNI